MTKQRIATIGLTLSLCGIAVLLWFLKKYSIISFEIISIQFMLVCTATYAFLSCLLNTLNKKKSSLLLGHILFVILCICVFYSKTPEDIITFVVCMILLLERMMKFHGCGCSVEDKPK